jgi:hypothetical protein
MKKHIIAAYFSLIRTSAINYAFSIFLVLATETYAARFSNHDHPSPQIFKTLATSLRERRSFQAKKKVVNSHVVTNEFNYARVLNMIENNPHISTRDSSTQLEISRFSVLRILSKRKFHPYHMELHGDAFQNRVAFCE